MCAQLPRCNLGLLTHLNSWTLQEQCSCNFQLFKCVNNPRLHLGSCAHLVRRPYSRKRRIISLMKNVVLSVAQTWFGMMALVFGHLEQWLLGKNFIYSTVLVTFSCKRYVRLFLAAIPMCHSWLVLDYIRKTFLFSTNPWYANRKGKQIFLTISLSDRIALLTVMVVQYMYRQSTQ